MHNSKRVFCGIYQHLHFSLTPPRLPTDNCSQVELFTLLNEHRFQTLLSVGFFMYDHCLVFWIYSGLPLLSLLLCMTWIVDHFPYLKLPLIYLFAPHMTCCCFWIYARGIMFWILSACIILLVLMNSMNFTQRLFLSLVCTLTKS